MAWSGSASGLGFCGGSADAIMCGIAALTADHPIPDLDRLLGRMMAAIRHRGPDEEGTFVAATGRAGLAHARLSIVDLTPRGRQPLLNEDGSLAVVCNGEIYNCRELRRDLEGRGHCFRSDSDSEVIVHLYEEMGERCVERLRGMFAFIVFDTADETLFCARDRIGKKPLVYAETAAGVGVASEIPALFDIPGVDLSIDAEAVALYLLRNLRHIPDPWTLYRGIRRLPPAHTMTVRGGRIQHIQSYWHPCREPLATTTEAFLDVFDRAVSLRRLADVEVGALLSGGVDSTAIVDSLGRQDVKGIRTYAFGRDPQDEELIRARRAALLLGTRHREVYFDPERQHDDFDALLRLHGEPIMALPLTHAYSLCREIRADGLKVVLAGHGADETFFGYSGFNRMAVLSDVLRLAPTVATRAISGGLARTLPPGAAREALLVASARPGGRKAALYGDEASRVWPVLLGRENARKLADDLIARWVEPWFADGAPAGYVDEAAYLGLMQENSHAVTIAGDLPAMAHGIEVRCPFLDHELVEMALRIPYRQKVVGIADRGRNKLFLKQALEQRLPTDILYAPKRGFGFFVQEEAVLRGPWKERVDAAFADFDGLGGVLDAEAARALKTEFDARGKVPAAMIAKLYALQRHRQLLRGPTGGAS